MTTTAYPATDKQLAFVDRLVAERDVVLNISDVAAFSATLREQRLTKDGASALINKLLSTPTNPKPDAPANEAPAHRPNRYGGNCGRCGKRVLPGEGYIVKSGGWVTFHHDGDCPEDLESKVEALLADLPDGYFAIPFIGIDADRNDLTFLGIRTTRAGKRYMVHVVGGHGEYDDMTIMWIEKAVAALKAADLSEAAALYGRELAHCGRCGRTLTDLESRTRGTGPECATKGW